MKITIDKKGILTFVPFVAIATMFWVGTFMTKKAGYSKDIVIKVIPPESKILLDTNIYNANVHLEGKGLDLIFVNSFNEGNPLIIKLRPNENQVTKEIIYRELQKEIANPDIIIQKIDFAGVNLHLDKKISKKVKLIFQGTIKYGKFSGPKSKPYLTPDKVLITGPKSMLDSIQKWKTEKKNFTDLTNTVEEVLNVEAPPNNKITIKPSKCKITIPVEAYTEKELSIPVNVAGSNINNIVTLPTHVSVSFLVGVSKYESIDSSYFYASIYYDKNDENKNNFPVSIIKKPKDVKILFIQPDYVDVIYKTHKL